MQPVDTFQQLQSLHELEFAGSPRIESAMFSPNGRTVYVQTAAEVIDFGFDARPPLRELLSAIVRHG